MFGDLPKTFWAILPASLSWIKLPLQKLSIYLSWMWWNICGDIPIFVGMTVSIIGGIQMCCVKVPKTLLWNWIVSTNVYVSWAYLPGWGVNHDQEGGSPRARPFHCTSVGLTPAIISNVDNSTASFLLVGDCVRAIPWIYNSLAPVHELCQVKLFKFNRIFV